MLVVRPGGADHPPPPYGQTDCEMYILFFDNFPKIHMRVKAAQLGW